MGVTGILGNDVADTLNCVAPLGGVVGILGRGIVGTSGKVLSVL